MLELLLITALAGIVATGLGGLISVILLKRSTENMTCWMLSFAAGIMTSIVCFGLLHESTVLAGLPVTVPGLVLGIAIPLILDRVVDRFASRTKFTVHDKAAAHSHGENEAHEPGCGHEHSHEAHGHSHGYNAHGHAPHTHGQLHHAGILTPGKAKMFRSGIILITAVGVHNFPEGMVIGAGWNFDTSLGTILAATIALHNIPIGVAISLPLIVSGIGRVKAVVLAALTGISLLIGAVLGYLIVGTSDLVASLTLAAAGGAMLYVVFGELIPQSVALDKKCFSGIITLIGFIIGFVICNLWHWH